MEKHQLELQRTANDLQSIIQSRDALNLANMKLLCERISLLEEMVAIALQGSCPELAEHQREVATTFKDRIAKIESRHEKIEGGLERARKLLEGLSRDDQTGTASGG